MKFLTKGFDEFLDNIQGEPKLLDELAPEMLKVAAEIVQKAQVEQAQSTFNSKRSTGDLARSIKVKPVKDKSVMVELVGNNRRGVANAQVGFVQEYGRKNMRPRPWMSVANEKAEEPAIKAMLEIWSKAHE